MKTESNPKLFSKIKTQIKERRRKKNILCVLPWIRLNNLKKGTQNIMNSVNDPVMNEQ